MIALLGPILMFAASFYYLIHLRKIDGILLLVGSLINLLMSLFLIYLPYYVQSRALSVQTMNTYLVIGSIIGTIGTLIFLVGFFILIHRHIKLGSMMVGSDKKM